MDLNTYIAPNFQLKEFIRPEWTDKPNEMVLDNIQMIAQRLQVIRDFYNRPIKINSGWRPPWYNEQIGGSPQSAHMYGRAVDINIDGITPKQFQKDFKHWNGGMGCYETFTHIDISSKRRW